MVYAVDGVAFPVQPDAYMSMSSDQVVTGRSVPLARVLR